LEYEIVRGVGIHVVWEAPAAAPRVVVLAQALLVLEVLRAAALA